MFTEIPPAWSASITHPHTAERGISLNRAENPAGSNDDSNERTGSLGNAKLILPGRVVITPFTPLKKGGIILLRKLQ